MKYIYVVFMLAIISCEPATKDIKRIPSLDKATVVTYRNIDVNTFNQEIKDSNIVVLDVRTPEEIAKGKINDAIELDFYNPDFANQLLKMDKSKEYYVYCKGGGRSAKTARLMIQNGFENVSNLDGGYTAWKKNAR